MTSVDDIEMDMQIAELAISDEMVAGTVDAIPAEQPFRKTVERTPGGPRTIRAQTMTPAQYTAGLSALGLTPWHAAPVLCVGVRQSYRYAAGSATIPPTVAKLLRALVKLGGDV